MEMGVPLQLRYKTIQLRLTRVTLRVTPSTVLVKDGPGGYRYGFGGHHYSPQTGNHIATPSPDTERLVLGDICSSTGKPSADSAALAIL